MKFVILYDKYHHAKIKTSVVFQTISGGLI